MGCFKLATLKDVADRFRIERSAQCRVWLVRTPDLLMFPLSETDLDLAFGVGPEMKWL